MSSKPRLRHIGAAAFQAERLELLSRYDVEKARNVDEPVRASHGHEAEAVLRAWFRRFLPKRFGVAKGAIITSRLDYDGPQEEWDVILYDALNSPVLFSSGPAGTSEQKRAIPVEHVRGVVEVKASLNPSSAGQVASKLLKLVDHIGVDDSEYPKYLKNPFVCCSVFFELNVGSLAEYRRALSTLAVPLSRPEAFPFLGSLVLRSPRNAEHSAYLQLMESLTPMGFQEQFELCEEFRFPDGRYGSFGAFMWGVNAFQQFVFDLLAMMSGTKTNKVSSFYGVDYSRPEGSRLFS